MDVALNSLVDFPFYALLALSFYVSFRVLNFPDLAVDAAYALGMALLVALTSRVISIPILLGLPLSIPLGMAVGACTASLHGSRRVRLSKLLAGLVVSFAMFSVNFRFNKGASTQGLYGTHHEFNGLRALLINCPPQTYRIIVFAICVIGLLLAIAIVAMILRRGLGANLRVVGYRPNLMTEAGGSPIFYLILGLGLADTIAVACGCLRAAADNYADINTFGTFLYALASLLLGERILSISKWGRRNRHRLRVQLLAPVLGGLAMSFLVQTSIWLLSTFMNVYMSTDIRLIIALVLIVTAANPKSAKDAKGASNGFW